MTFSDYMHNLPNLRQDTIKKLAEITYSDISTIYRWMSGSFNPPMVKKKIIAEFLQLKVEDLWPPDNRTKEG